MSPEIAVDAAIFFFCFDSGRADIKPANMQRLLKHLSGAPHISLYVPISVLGESVIECLRGERGDKAHSLSELHEMIDLWGSLNLNFLYPSKLVAEACYRLVEKYKTGDKIDYRLTDTDLVHLGYALAYKMDYFLTTDMKLKYNVPEKSSLRVIDHEEAKKLF
jgi:hypothetical protein